MAKILSPGEVIEALYHLGATEVAAAFRNSLLNLAEAAAEELADLLDAEVGETTYEPGLGHEPVMTAFSARRDGQEWPDVISHLDEDGDFDRRLRDALEHEVLAANARIAAKAQEADGGDDEEEATMFRNHYRCTRCGNEWTDTHSCQVDDDCPKCGARHMSPYKSEDA